jgi:hypothetical protein
LIVNNQGNTYDEGKQRFLSW